MSKRIIAFLLCLCFCFCLIPAAAVEPQVRVSFEKDEIVVGNSVKLLINLSSDIIRFKADIASSNNCFLYYSGKDVDFDTDSLEYTVNITASNGSGVVICHSSNSGYTSVTLKNIICETSEGTVELEDITTEIFISPNYTYIYTKEDLNNIRFDLSGDYLLMNDIAFTEADFAEGGAFYNDGFGWIPIGAVVKTPFAGEFNGNDHTISGLKINKAYYNYCGLFGVSKGTVHNLRMTDADIDTTVGINMSSKSQIPQPDNGNVDPEDKNIWTEPDDGVSEEQLNGYDRTGSSSANSGIICGFNLGSIKNSYCQGTVTGNSASGGIVGRNNGVVSHCASYTEVLGGILAGGVAGVTGSYSKISDVVVEGSVSGNISGGLIGKASGNVSRTCVLAQVTGVKSFASFGKDAGVSALEAYAFGEQNSDRITQIKVMGELASLRFTEGQWTYTSVMPYPTPLSDIVHIIVLGDTNGNGKVDTVDLAIMKLYLAGMGELDEIASDMNADQKVDTSDLAMLKLKLANE